jgi:hypothetical protein
MAGPDVVLTEVEEDKRFPLVRAHKDFSILATRLRNRETGLILKSPHSVRILDCQLNAIGNRLKQIAVNYPASDK